MSEERNTRLIERIQKLIALSTSPNENEAMSAAEKVQVLLAEHGLSMSDVEVNDDLNKFIKDADFLTDTAAWVRPLLHQLAQLYFCGYFFTSMPKFWMSEDEKSASRTLRGGGHATAYLRHSFVGAHHNIVVIKNMAEYLITTMERLCKDAESSVPAKERGSFRVSFMNACSGRVCFRLQERRKQTATQGIHTNGTNLPALMPLYDQAKAAYDQWLKDNEMNLRSVANRARITNASGMAAGRRAGDSIGLDDQVTGHGAKRIAHSK